MPQDQLKLGLNEGQTEDAADKETADENGGIMKFTTDKKAFMAALSACLKVMHHARRFRYWKPR